MTATAKMHEWTRFLRFYSEQHRGRPTRLGVFEPTGDTVTDYWLESGLPLTGIDVSDEAKPLVQVIVGDMTHEIEGPRSLIFRFTDAGDEDGLDITDKDGRTTVLRFELRRSNG